MTTSSTSDPERSANRNPLTSNFGAVYVISLKERADRQNETRLALRQIGQDPALVTWFYATRPADKGVFPSAGVRGAFESHLNVLTQAYQSKCDSVLVLEDDVDFTSRTADIAKRLQDGRDWHIFYGGHFRPDGTPSTAPGAQGFRAAGPEEEFIGLHCYAVNGQVLSTVIEQLQDFPKGKAGDPMNGPMPVDGAFNIIRRKHPGLISLLAVPPVANQRASRTDIGELKWFDRMPFMKMPVSAGRKMKNMLKRLKR